MDGEVMRALMILVCIAGTASANPAVKRDDLKAAVASLAEQLEEPVGLLVTQHLPKLQLLKGDVLLAVNGIRVLEPHAMHLAISTVASLVQLEVIRAGKPVSVRLDLDPGRVEVSEDRTRVRNLASLRTGMKGITKHGAPAGVVVTTDWFGMGGAIRGDVLRKVEGKPVTTVEQASKAIEAALAQPKIMFDLERNGRPYVLALQLVTDPSDDPELGPLIDKIELVDATTYKVPKKLFEKAAANPMVFGKGARIVPAIKNGKPEGMKLYAIRPSSLYAKLGFANGDTLVSINGVAVATIGSGKAADVFAGKLTAKHYKLELVRRGKPVSLEWTLK
jgi:type II secretory pathway component PulC